MTATTPEFAAPRNQGPKRGVTVSDWKVFAAIAGGSFFANLVALITVVHVMLAPVRVEVAGQKARLDRHDERMESLAEEVHDHEGELGHHGMMELYRRLEKQLDRLESQGG